MPRPLFIIHLLSFLAMTQGRMLVKAVTDITEAGFGEFSVEKTKGAVKALFEYVGELETLD